MLDAYDRNTNKFHPAFISKATINFNFFSFATQDGMPASIANDFLINQGQDLTTLSASNGLYLFLLLNKTDEMVASANYKGLLSSSIFLVQLSSFIKKATTVVTTTPTLLLQARQLFSRVSDRLDSLMAL